MSLDNIDDVLVDEGEPHYNKRRPVLAGSFNLSRATAIPYFQSVMNLREVASELQLVEDLPSDLRDRWRLEELFQREIDWDRVKQEILKGYLERPEKLQFFNSLTVALLPTDTNRNLEHSYGEAINPPDVPEALGRHPWDVRNAGNVQLITNERTANGYVSWDPDRVFPATIDGQHRLAALKTFLSNANLTTKQLETTISVLFLVLDSRAGFQIGVGHTADNENPILTVVREIFIDLNLSAKEVARSRRILLDDQEIESRCVRKLLAPRVGDRTDGLLPLGLVHWQHKVSVKFNSGDHTGPFVTTAELLYLIVMDILDLDRPKDPLDEGQVRKFIRSVEEALGVSRLIAENPARYPGLVPLMSYVERNYLKEGFEQPFANLPGPYLRVCDDGFERQWLNPIVTVLTQFKVYRDFIAQVDARGGIDGDLAFYLCLPLKAQKKQAEEWGEQRYAKLDTPLKELAEMKADAWPFFAVFQKGLLRATKNALVHSKTVTGLGSASEGEILAKWIEFLDTCLDRGLLKVKCPIAATGTTELWAGISINPGSRTVKWSDASVERICSLITLWWQIYANKLARVGSFLKKAEAPRGDESYPGAKKALKVLRGALPPAVKYGEDDLAEEEVTKRVQKRLVAILKLGPHGEASSSDVDEETEETEEATPAPDAGD